MYYFFSSLKHLGKLFPVCYSLSPLVFYISDMIIVHYRLIARIHAACRVSTCVLKLCTHWIPLDKPVHFGEMTDAHIHLIPTLYDKRIA